MSAKKLMTTLALAVLAAGGAMAQNAGNPAAIYGSQLMTQQERIEYRTQMRALKTQEERNAFRLEHHKKMQERAQERGQTLPDAPPAAGPGRGMGGGGMGPGGGMGGGMGGRGPR
jgi:Ni/Co efflux regulator RcnB